MKRKRRPRLPSLKALRGRAHGLWARIVRAQHPVCTVCGCAPSAQAHHLLSKRHFASLRFAPRVGRGVCAGCHIRVHASPALQVLALAAEEVERLRVLVREYQPVVWNRENLNLVRVGLETMLTNLPAGKEVSAA